MSSLRFDTVKLTMTTCLPCTVLQHDVVNGAYSRTPVLLHATRYMITYSGSQACQIRTSAFSERAHRIRIFVAT